MLSCPVVDSPVALAKLASTTSESPDSTTGSGVLVAVGTQPISPLVMTVLASKTPILWASKFNSSLCNLKKVSRPSILEDGSPSVAAPDPVLLQSYEIWKDHLVSQFHGMPPSAAKVFSDLNPIWGSQGCISIREYSARTLLIYIPSEVTRKWALDVAFWQAGNCSFSVFKWSSSVNLAPKPLTTAPVGWC